MSTPPSRPQKHGDPMQGLWPRLLRNAGWLLTGSAGRSVLGFLAGIYLARILGPDMFGQVGYAMAVLTYFILITDGGLQALGTREVAAGQGSTPELAGRVLVIRGVLTALSLLVILFGATFMTPNESTASLLLVFSFALLPLAVNLAWVFRGHEQMRMVGISEMIQVGVYLGLLLLLVRGPGQLLLIPVFFVVSHGLASLVVWAGQARRWGWPKIAFRGGGHLSMLGVSLPVVVNLFLHQVCFSFDTLMLGFIRGDREVGLYNAVFRIVISLISVISVLMEAIFPTFSRLFVVGRDALRRVMEKALTITVILALPVGVGGTVLSRPLILALYGQEFEESGLILPVMVWSAVLAFVGAAYGYCLVACGRQKILAWTAAAGALGNVLLNLWLIPRHGMYGACVATVASQGLMLVLQAIVFSRRVVRALPLVGLSLQAVLASLVMGLVLIALRDLVPVWLAVPAGAGVYAGFLWLLARRQLRDLFDLDPDA